MGTELTGITTATLAMKYIDAINEEGVSNINSTWEQVIEHEYDRMFDEAKNLFQGIIQKQFHVNELPYEEKDITLCLAQAKDRQLPYSRTPRCATRSMKGRTWRNLSFTMISS